MHSLNSIEYAFNTLFSFELGLRLFTLDRCRDAFHDPYLIFDALSVVPFGCQLLVNTVTGSSGRSQLVQVTKAMRMLRMLKLARQFDGSIVIYRTLRVSLSALGVPFFFLFIAVVVFGASTVETW